jgi:serine/threonine protein kinase
VARYAAPELRNGRTPDTRSDIFAFAVTVSEIVTNGKQARPPFPNFIEPSITALLSRAWAPNPDERPTIDEIIDALNEIGFLPLTLENVDGRWEANQQH